MLSVSTTRWCEKHSRRSSPELIRREAAKNLPQRLLLESIFGLTGRIAEDFVEFVPLLDVDLAVLPFLSLGGDYPIRAPRRRQLGGGNPDKMRARRDIAKARKGFTRRERHRVAAYSKACGKII